MHRSCARIVFSIVLAMLAVTALAPAQAATGDPEAVLKAWLDVLNRADEAGVVEEFIRARFAPRLADAIPMDEHVSRFGEMHREYGRLELHSIREKTDDRIQALLHNDRNRWFLATLFIEAESGLVRGLGFDDGADPPEVLDAPRAADLEAWVKAIRGYADRRAEQDLFSGTVIVRLDGAEACRGAWGLASMRYGVPNQVDTKFNLGSMNKMFTAVAVAQLAEQGKLAYTDLVGRHLPDYPNAAVREKVTIHHLLSHTSGMGNHFTDEFIRGAKDQYRHFTAYIPLFADEPLAFDPGERFSYSNAGFFVLGLIIEAASGESYYDYIRKHIYVPAGMANSDCYDVDLSVPNLATGYTRERFDEPSVDDHAPWMEALGPWRENTLMHSVKGGPAGGGYSTVEDLTRFAMALTDGTLVSSETLALLTSAKSDLVTEPDGGVHSYGYGFGVGAHGDGTPYFGHTGGFPGINAVLRIYPTRRGSIAVMSNQDDGALEVRAFAARTMPASK